jgi:benzoyl-CoA reductase/2-hydroxyglutaryl-CoA dehydratase subunit BcrC/BadD/HgdB
VEVRFTNPWVPAEWIRAHGFAPRGMWSALSDPSPTVVGGACSFAESVKAAAGTRPDAPVVFASACDPMRRAADAVTAGRGARGFLFNLPATWQTGTARRLYRAEVMRLGRFLERLGGRAPTPAELEAVIRDHEQRREQLRRFIAQGTARQNASAVLRFFADGSVPGEAPAAPDDGVRLALVGGPFLTSQGTFWDALEAAGGCVVLNATEPGERCLLPPLPPGSLGPDAIVRLADHYFDHIIDVFQRPHVRLYDWLGERLSARGARGIVLAVHVGCDLWRAEAASLREAFGLPVLVLDSPSVGGGGLRDLNRLSAFVESLR